MFEWFSNLDLVTQILLSAGVFFGIIFLWQLVMSILGFSDMGHDFAGQDMGGHDAFHEAGYHGGHVDQMPGADAAHMHDPNAPADVTELTGDHLTRKAHRTLSDFKFFSVRSLVAFFTLFTWTAAISLLKKEHPVLIDTLTALGIGLAWGVVGLLAVSALMFWLGRMGESGNMRLETCVGTNGTVYLDIPRDGLGEVRCMVSGCVTLVKARGAGGQAIKAGTPVLVLNKIDQTIVEVQPLESDLTKTL